MSNQKGEGLRFLLAGHEWDPRRPPRLALRSNYQGSREKSRQKNQSAKQQLNNICSGRGLRPAVPALIKSLDTHDCSRGAPGPATHRQSWLYRGLVMELPLVLPRPCISFFPILSSLVNMVDKMASINSSLRFSQPGCTRMCQEIF